MPVTGPLSKIVALNYFSSLHFKVYKIVKPETEQTYLWINKFELYTLSGCSTGGKSDTVAGWSPSELDHYPGHGDNWDNTSL